MAVDGFDLIIHGAQREDDSDIQCSLQNSNLKKRIKLSVLGEFRFLFGLRWSRRA